MELLGSRKTMDITYCPLHLENGTINTCTFFYDNREYFIYLFIYNCVVLLDSGFTFTSIIVFSQDAKKGVLFIDFPPVLQLQLKRFEYDFMRDTMVKVSELLTL